MPLEAHEYEELANVKLNGPIWPGDSISHDTLNSIVGRGWAVRYPNGLVGITDAGLRALKRWIEETP